MSDITNDQLLDLANDTIEWGREISELWTGTMYEKQIDRQVDQIKMSVKDNDLQKTRALVFDLAQFLHHAEEQYER